jgi:hypothetical protein
MLNSDNNSEPLYSYGWSNKMGNIFLWFFLYICLHIRHTAHSNDRFTVSLHFAAPCFCLVAGDSLRYIACNFLKRWRYVVPEPTSDIPFDLYNNFIGAGWKFPTVRKILFQKRSVKTS